MEIAKLILEYLKVIIIPLSVLLVFFSIRKELKALLEGKFTAKYKDLTIELERKLEHKEVIIESMQENLRDASQIVEKELEQLQKQEKWSGLDYKANRIASALASIRLNSGEHVIVNFLRKRGGESSINELLNELIKPDSHMLSHQFQMEKNHIDNDIESLKKKGIVSASNLGKLKLHPWAMRQTDEEKIQSAEEPE